MAEAEACAVRAHNNALEWTVIRHRVRAASASLHCALAARRTRFWAAAQRERYTALDVT